MNKIYEDDRDILLFSFSTILSIGVVILLINKRKRDSFHDCLDIDTERLIFLVIRICYVILAIIFVIIAYDDLMKCMASNSDNTKIKRQEEILVSAFLLLIASLINLDVINIDTINNY